MRHRKPVFLDVRHLRSDQDLIRIFQRHLELTGRGSENGSNPRTGRQANRVQFIKIGDPGAFEVPEIINIVEPNATKIVETLLNTK